MNIQFISVDFQKEFTNKKGKWFNPGSSISFMKETLIPYFSQHNIKINEIVSDYRQPRPGDAGDGCYPGTDGYESEIPQNIKKGVWIKCMNSPLWTRKNIGISGKKPGLPYQDPEKLTNWLNQNVGKPNDVDFIVLIGLTIDYCVFSTAQELRWRGYKVKILYEATDAVGDENYKNQITTKSPLLNWAKIIKWKELKKQL